MILELVTWLIWTACAGWVVSIPWMDAEMLRRGFDACIGGGETRADVPLAGVEVMRRRFSRSTSAGTRQGVPERSRPWPTASVQRRGARWRARDLGRVALTSPRAVDMLRPA